MIRTNRESVLPLLEEILLSRSVEDGTRSVSAAIDALGYGGFGFGLVWGSKTVTEGAATLVGGNMAALIPRYLERELVGVDPVAQALRTAREPILWDLSKRSGGHSLEESGRRRVIALMDEFNIAAGVSIPIDIPAIGCRAALSVSAPSGMDQFGFDILYASSGPSLRLAGLALAAALSNELVRPRDFQLSDNERQVLEALTDGLRPREIARRLGKSEHTVRNQIASAQQRLGARTKEQALVTAARQGLITL